LPDNFFDAVVGNVPFGDYGVHDPAYKRPQTAAIHDYFFAKSIDRLRPIGVLALITSRYTMDRQDGATRCYLAERADLVARYACRTRRSRPTPATSSHDDQFAHQTIIHTAPIGEVPPGMYSAQYNQR
jgi:hypothetical protein